MLAAAEREGQKYRVRSGVSREGTSVCTSRWLTRCNFGPTFIDELHKCIFNSVSNSEIKNLSLKNFKQC